MNFMSLKEELLKSIAAIEDENLLKLLEEDLRYFTHINKSDVTDNLSAEQMEELRKLSEEDDNKEVVNFEAFRNRTDKWRTK